MEHFCFDVLSSLTLSKSNDIHDKLCLNSSGKNRDFLNAN